MKHGFPFIVMVLFSSCTSLPQLYQTAEDIADDIAIKIEVSREAIQKQTDVILSVDVKNKDPEVKK